MWLLLVEASFVGFIIGLFALVWRGFDRDGMARRGWGVWLMAVMLSFVLLCIGLSRVPRPDRAIGAPFDAGPAP